MTLGARPATNTLPGDPGPFRAPEGVSMDGQKPAHRYEMVNIRPGYIIVEHEVFSRAMRSYFSTQEIPPIEEYREGAKIWKFSGMAQSFHFDLLDRQTGVPDVQRFVAHLDREWGALFGFLRAPDLPHSERTIGS